MCTWCGYPRRRAVEKHGTVSSRQRLGAARLLPQTTLRGAASDGAELAESRLDATRHATQWLICRRLMPLRASTSPRSVEMKTRFQPPKRPAKDPGRKPSATTDRLGVILTSGRPFVGQGPAIPLRPRPPSPGRAPLGLVGVWRARTVFPEGPAPRSSSEVRVVELSWREAPGDGTAAVARIGWCPTAFPPEKEKVRRRPQIHQGQANRHASASVERNQGTRSPGPAQRSSLTDARNHVEDAARGPGRG